MNNFLKNTIRVIANFLRLIDQCLDIFRKILKNKIVSYFLTISMLIFTGSMLVNNLIELQVKIMAGFVFIGTIILLIILIIDRKTYL